MTDQPEQNRPDEGKDKQGRPPEPVTQEVRHSQVSARVPEKVRNGVFSTGAIVLQGPQEFILDFVQRLAHPHTIAARVILPPGVVARFIAALQENLRRYEQHFGPPPRLPTPPVTGPPPSIEDIYDQLKLPDEQLSGVYANAVMISHTPAEFCLDFITNFYPRSAVSCRVFLSAAQAPRFLETLSRSFQQFQQKVAAQRQQWAAQQQQYFAQQQQYFAQPQPYPPQPGQPAQPPGGPTPPAAPGQQQPGNYPPPPGAQQPPSTQPPPPGGQQQQQPPHGQQPPPPGGEEPPAPPPPPAGGPPPPPSPPFPPDA